MGVEPAPPPRARTHEELCVNGAAAFDHEPRDGVHIAGDTEIGGPRSDAASARRTPSSSGSAAPPPPTSSLPSSSPCRTGPGAWSTSGAHSECSSSSSARSRNPPGGSNPGDTKPKPSCPDWTLTAFGTEAAASSVPGLPASLTAVLDQRKLPAGAHPVSKDPDVHNLRGGRQHACRRSSPGTRRAKQADPAGASTRGSRRGSGP